MAGGGETLVQYNAGMLKRLVIAKLLPEAIAKRVRFDLPATTKSGLIREGGMDAARAKDFFKEEQRLVLLPQGLASRDRDGNTTTLERPALVSLSEFREKWLGLMKNESEARHAVSLEMSNEAMKNQFPLTYSYWTSGKKDRRDDLHNVFDTSTAFAPLYMDAGGLYLTGTPLLGGRSFAWLMAQYAQDGA